MEILLDVNEQTLGVSICRCEGCANLSLIIQILPEAQEGIFISKKRFLGGVIYITIEKKNSSKNKKKERTFVLFSCGGHYNVMSEKEYRKKKMRPCKRTGRRVNGGVQLPLHNK
ncbi:MAG: hypothetical protein EOM19_00895 [Candidatus Moranbacteria bacterium]|nr:hypothetical protein [Candidatus Moranbacteria bacterium]